MANFYRTKSHRCFALVKHPLKEKRITSYGNVQELKS